MSGIHGPLVFPILWREHGPHGSVVKSNPALLPEQLDALMRLFEIISLSLRTSMSDCQLAKIEELIQTWQRHIFAIHPSLKTATNLHVISHLTEDITRHGPVYGWWSFPFERVNLLVKQTNRSASLDRRPVFAKYPVRFSKLEVKPIKTMFWLTDSGLRLTKGDHQSTSCTSQTSSPATTLPSYKSLRGL